MTDSEVLFSSKGDLLAWLGVDLKVVLCPTDRPSESSLLPSRPRAKNLALNRAEKKILHRADFIRFGFRSRHKKIIHCRPKLTYEVIMAMAGMTRGTIKTEPKSLRKPKIMSFSSKCEIVVNKEQGQARSGCLEFLISGN